MKSPLSAYPIEELKLVYRVLRTTLTENVDLLDSRLMADLQAYLHGKAMREGIDVTDHRSLDRWLGADEAAACARRLPRGARILQFPTPPPADRA